MTFNAMCSALRIAILGIDRRKKISIARANRALDLFVRLKRTLSYLICAHLIVLLLMAPQVFAQAEEVPPDVFEARPGDYLYADYPGDFDTIERGGITVEAWIYLTERPEDRALEPHSNGNWLILAKPGSYFITMSGRALDTEQAVWAEGSTVAYFGLLEQPQPDSQAAGVVGRILKPEEFPLARWVHVGLQIAGDRREARMTGLYDRTHLGFLLGGTMGRTAAPLLIGGPKLVTFGEDFLRKWWGRGYESMRGYIDEVRISKGLRYDVNLRLRSNEIRPKRHFRADAQTIALWRFEEGPGKPRYADSSGNGYTLVAGGSLAVHPHGKLATTWGSLKRGTF